MAGHCGCWRGWRLRNDVRTQHGENAHRDDGIDDDGNAQCSHDVPRDRRAWIGDLFAHSGDAGVAGQGEEGQPRRTAGCRTSRASAASSTTEAMATGCSQPAGAA